MTTDKMEKWQTMYSPDLSGKALQRKANDSGSMPGLDT